jgi:DNA modification methylase
LVWGKTNPTPATNNVWLPDLEYCLYFKETGIKLNDGYELKSKWFISPLNMDDKNQFGHPTIKPLELVKRHLLHATQENDIILDPFMGSGTTALAAKEIKRQFVGFEIDSDYHKIAVDRLNGINKGGQTSIFTDFDNL